MTTVKTVAKLHVVLVTDGTVIEYAPEIYVSSERAALEAERWAWILSGGGWLPVERPFDGRWVVGDRDVRIVVAEAPSDASGSLWVGTYWSEDGLPDPEAVLLEGREAAVDWVQDAGDLGPVVATIDRPWFVGATYAWGDDEAYAVAHLGKRVGER